MMPSRLQQRLAQREAQRRLLQAVLDTRVDRRALFAREWGDSPFARLYTRCRAVLNDRHWRTLQRLLQVEDRWVRTPETWRASGRSESALAESLVRHLLCTYAMPQWWFPMWTAEPEYWFEDGDLVEQDPFTATEARIFARVAQGTSFRDVVDCGDLPVPLSRKECHALRTQHGVAGLVPAVRKTQVLSRRGTRRLARALIDTSWGDAVSSWTMEGRRAEMLTWLCQQRDVRDAQVLWLTEYFNDRRGRLRLRGRGVAHLLREVAEHHEARGVVPIRDRLRPAGARVDRGWQRSGYAGWQRGRVTIVELLSYRALVEEGRALRHCVATYAAKATCGVASLWGYRVNGVPRLTIEIRNQHGLVVQIRGRDNRPASSAELATLRIWAEQEGLRFP